MMKVYNSPVALTYSSSAVVVVRTSSDESAAVVRELQALASVGQLIAGGALEEMLKAYERAQANTSLPRDVF